MISLAPEHFIWKRHRLSHHSGALRNYMKPGIPQYGRTSPVYCEDCLRAQEEEEKHLSSTRLTLSYSFPTQHSVTVGSCYGLQKMDLLDEIDFDYRESYYSFTS